MRSCAKMLAWHLGSFVAIFMKLDAGDLGSNLDDLSYLGDLRKSFSCILRTFFLRCCLVADLLAGRPFRRRWCSCLQFLYSPSAARFASTSAFSFPSIPSCPGTHCIFSLTLGHFSSMSLIKFLASSMR